MARRKIRDDENIFSAIVENKSSQRYEIMEEDICKVIQEKLLDWGGGNKVRVYILEDGRRMVNSEDVEKIFQITAEEKNLIKISIAPPKKEEK